MSSVGEELVLNLLSQMCDVWKEVHMFGISCTKHYFVKFIIGSTILLHFIYWLPICAPIVFKTWVLVYQAKTEAAP